MNIVKVITDKTLGITTDQWELCSSGLLAADVKHPWRVTKRTLRGGRQEGVEIVEVDSGVIQFVIVPTRGMSVWSGKHGETTLGWNSWSKEIVHPRFIDLKQREGLGWLDGFGGWIVRCGLSSIGPPCVDHNESLTLHGRIDYLAAEQLVVSYEASPLPRLIVRGIVREDCGSSGSLELATEFSIEIGSTKLRITDVITNRCAEAREMQMLYHINFGPPLLGKGAEFLAPIAKIFPRDPRAAEATPNLWTRFQGSTAGYTEQVYFMELHADQDGKTAAMLRAPDHKSAALLRFNVRDLPYFTLWKNEAELDAGYVAGLEPATSYPNSRPRERERGRVPTLMSGQSHAMSIDFELLTSLEAVQREEIRMDLYRQAPLSGQP